MRGKWSRRSIDRLENLLIALLACSALVLIVQSGLGQAAGRGTGSGGETVFTGVQGTALSRGTPVRMMVQTEHGRYGVQYDQDTVDTLYAEGISQLLTEAVEAMDTPRPATREDWQEAITQSSRWVYCDFLYNISFVAQGSGGEGAGRAFLLSAPGGRVEAVYYYNQETGEYYAGRVAGAALTFPSTLEGLGDNGARFAFEDPQVAETLSPDTLVLSQAPVTPVYAVANPVAAWGEAEHTALLEALDFNLRAIALYETTEGTVLQEGPDTLRIQKDGQVLYHAAALQEQTLAYLSSRGIAVAAETIPWESGLSTEVQDLPAQLLDPGDLPAEGLPAACEIQPALEAPALLMDFALGAAEAGLPPLTIQAIREGYQYSGEADRAVLTPMWELTTDRGTFLLSGAEGTLLAGG